MHASHFVLCDCMSDVVRFIAYCSVLIHVHDIDNSLYKDNSG